MNKYFLRQAYMGLGGLSPQIRKFLEPPDLGGRPIFGLYKGNFGLCIPRNPPPQPILATHICGQVNQSRPRGKSIEFGKNSAGRLRFMSYDYGNLLTWSFWVDFTAMTTYVQEWEGCPNGSKVELCESKTTSSPVARLKMQALGVDANSTFLASSAVGIHHVGRQHYHILPLVVFVEIQMLQRRNHVLLPNARLIRQVAKNYLRS